MRSIVISMCVCLSVYSHHS